MSLATVDSQYFGWLKCVGTTVGVLLGGFVMVLDARSGRNRSSEETYLVFKHKKVTTMNHDPKILMKVTVI